MAQAVRMALTTGFLILGFLTWAGIVGCGPDGSGRDRSTANAERSISTDVVRPSVVEGSPVAESVRRAKSEQTPSDPVGEPEFVEAKAIVDRYPSGKRRREYTQHVHLNAPALRHGPFKEWHENGQLQKSGDYRKGSKVGPWNWWSENGTLLKTGRYTPQGQLVGSWRFFRPDGTTERVESFSEGEKDGAWIWYDASGERPVVREQFSRGKRHGLSQRWHAPGPKHKGPLVLLREVPYVDGHEHGEATEYFSDGKKKVRVSYRNGRRHGTSVEWDENGEVIAEHAYRDGEPVEE